MLAAFLEWFLWLAAFMYCLFKVFQKAEHWSVRVLSIIVAIVFFLLRYGIYSKICVGFANRDLLQSDLSAHHGCHASFTRRSHSIFPKGNGYLPSMVRILVVRSSSHHSMALLRISNCNKFLGTKETYKASVR